MVEGHEALEKRQVAPKPAGEQACGVITVGRRGGNEMIWEPSLQR